MTRAGPTNTYGRTPSRSRPGSRSTSWSIAQNTKNTPTTPSSDRHPDHERAGWRRRRAGSRSARPRTRTATTECRTERPRERRCQADAGQPVRRSPPRRPRSARAGASGAHCGICRSATASWPRCRPRRRRASSGPPLTYSIIPVQKLPLPTAAGMRSEASKRPVPSLSAVVSTSDAPARMSLA